VWGMAVSPHVSDFAMLGSSITLLPPVGGTFTIARPDRIGWLRQRSGYLHCWQQLSARSRRKRLTKHSRRHETAALSFSQKLLSEGQFIQLMNAIHNYIVDSLKKVPAELFLPHKDKFYR